MTIHHATQTKAAKHGIKLTELDDGTVTFENSDGVLSPAYADGKLALIAALAYEDDAEASEGDEEDEDDEPTGTIVKRHYRDEYKARGDATTCGDDIAYAMKDFVTVKDAKGKDAMSMNSLAMLAGDNEEDVRLAGYVKKGLNPGQCRMNIGNVLRNRYEGGDAVEIGNATWQATDEEVLAFEAAKEAKRAMLSK